MTAVTSEETIAARLLPALRALGKPVTGLEIARTVCADSSVVFRILSNHPKVKAVRSRELTTFEWKESP